MVVVVEHYNNHMAPVDYDDHITLAEGYICSYKMVAIPFFCNELVKKESIVCVLDCSFRLNYHHMMHDGMMNDNYLYYVNDVDAGCGGEKNCNLNLIKKLCYQMNDQDETFDYYCCGINTGIEVEIKVVIETGIKTGIVTGIEVGNDVGIDIGITVGIKVRMDVGMKFGNKV